MIPMPNINLPFFAYGTFKPGQIAYSRIEKFVKSQTYAKCMHKMFLRDGIPFIIRDSGEHDSTGGFFIEFEWECRWNAYNIICETLSEKLYYWDVIEVEGKPANALIGRSPSKSRPMRLREDFDGSRDPYFNEVLEVVSEGIKEYYDDSKRDEKDPYEIKKHFRLLRNYILLWAAIERYVSLRYGRGFGKSKEKLAEERIFKNSLKSHIGHEKRDIYRTDNLDKITLDANIPEDCLDYYYTIRCNIVHRGKDPSKEGIVLKSLVELLEIFTDVFNDTFNES